MKAKQIKALRENFGYTLDQFGKMIGVAASTIFFWENNIHKPRRTYIHILNKFAEKIAKKRK